MDNAMVNKRYFVFLSALIVTLAHPFTALAQLGAEDIAENIVTSSANLPGVVSAFGGLSGLILVITGLLKFKEYMEDERRVPLRTPVIRLIAGGMCFTAPFIYNVVRTTIVGNDTSALDVSSLVNSVNLMMNTTAALLGAFTLDSNVATVLGNIGLFNNEITGLISVLAYLLAIVIGAAGILKIKEHVEEPEKVTIREPIVRLLTAGALFGLPAIYKAMYTSITAGSLGFFGTLQATITTSGFIFSSYGEGATAGCGETMVSMPGSSLGNVICLAMVSSIGLPSFLTGLSYLIGIIFGVWGVLKVRDHVLSPSQTKLSEGVTRLLAGGAFLGMPSVANALQNSIVPVTTIGAYADGSRQDVDSYAGTLSCSNASISLDQAMGCFVNNLLGPVQNSLSYFCFVAGLIFVMIGISRIIKSAQEGPRGPGGLGTISTFVTGAILMSITPLLSVLSATFFGDSETATFATMTFTGGMSATEINTAQNVISSVVKFMIIIGLISFARGVFIMRDSAEGKGQASVMSGMTHIIGGALAVNIGPLLNAVQSSLGVLGMGVTFS
jgi:hypothetical protein